MIIGSNDVTQEEILGCGNFGKVYKGTWQRKTQDGKAVSKRALPLVYTYLHSDSNSTKMTRNLIMMMEFNAVF